jgi:DNA-binding PadR family transcriptional regulator
MTAKENGILEETRYENDGAGGIRVYYKIAAEGESLMQRYLK